LEVATSIKKDPGAYVLRTGLASKFFPLKRKKFGTIPVEVNVERCTQNF